MRLRAASTLIVVTALVVAATAAGSSFGGRDPRVSWRPADQKLARAAVLRPPDFASTWKAKNVGKLDNSMVACDTFHPDLHDLTIRGQAASENVRVVNGNTLAVFTVVTVLDSRAQATAFFNRVAEPLRKFCFLRGPIASVAHAGPVTEFGVAGGGGSRSLAFHVVFTARGRKTNLDILLFLTGRTYGVLAFTSGASTFPHRLEAKLALKLMLRSSS